MYSARITRTNPAAFIFLIDQSGSMSEKMQFGRSTMSKAEVVAYVTNMLIRELTNRCRKEYGTADYFDVAAIGYYGREAKLILEHKDYFISTSKLAAMNCRVSNTTRERILPSGKTLLTTDSLKYWIEPRAEGGTPMFSALEKALLLTSAWCGRSANRTSYPPTIFNITDGEASDGDSGMLIDIARQITSLGTEDGNALLININITSKTSSEHLLFPCSSSELPDCQYARMLFEMSSPMPEEYARNIADMKGCRMASFRGMSLNTSATDLIAMMNIGSISANKTL